MSATTSPVHICNFLTSRVPWCQLNITVYLHENIILAQMSHKLSCKQFPSMEVGVDMYYVVGGMLSSKGKNYCYIFQIKNIVGFAFGQKHGRWYLGCRYCYLGSIIMAP